MAKKKIIALFVMAALLVTAALPVLVACNDKADVTGKGVERPENIFTDDIDTVDSDNLAAGARKTTQLMSAPSESDALSNDVMRAPSGARFNFRHLVSVSHHSLIPRHFPSAHKRFVFPFSSGFPAVRCHPRVLSRRMSVRYIRTK